MVSIAATQSTGFRPLTSYVDKQVGLTGRLRGGIPCDHVLRGTGVYDAITAYRPLHMWDAYSFTGKAATGLLQVAGTLAQAAVWFPVGLCMGVFGCLLGSAGWRADGAEVLTQYYQPIYMAFGAVEIAANAIGICLFSAWVGSLFRR